MGFRSYVRSLPTLGKLQWLACSLIPFVGILELLAHARQVATVITDHDWQKVREHVSSVLAPEELLVFSPPWTDPIGRHYFSESLASLERTARADNDRYARALDVAMKGASKRPEFASWPVEKTESIGPFEVRTLRNPDPVRILDDLLTHFSSEAMSVVEINGSQESPCSFVRTGSQSGNLGFGPAVPGARFACSSGSFSGISIINDIDYKPRRCFLSPPRGGSTVLRLRFANVRLGALVAGHHGLQAEAEHSKKTPVHLTLRTPQRVLGKVVHIDETGWIPFQFETSDLAGQTGELWMDITSSSGERRQYCIEGHTR